MPDRPAPLPDPRAEHTRGPWHRYGKSAASIHKARGEVLDAIAKAEGYS